MCFIRRIRESEKGTVLITMLILMVIITIMGVIAINTSTIDIQISTNTRNATSAFESTEAGVNLSEAVIEWTILYSSLTPSSATGIITSLDTTNLLSEIMGGMDKASDTPQSTPDIGISLNGVTVNVDIDRLYSAVVKGGALKFAAGYEGVGVGAGGGGVEVLYWIESQGSI